MSTTIEITLLKIAVAVAIVLGLMGATWFGASAHYSKLYEALKASTVTQAKADQKAEDEKKRANETVSKDVNDEAVAQIGTMSDTIAGLLMRKPSTITVSSNVCPAPASPASPDGHPNGPAASGNAGTPAGTPGTATIDIDTERDALTIGIDAITTELLWREYARRTGQAH